METNQSPALQGPQLVTGPVPTLLELQAIRKVFYTDEVETHALSDVHLAVKKGEWLAIVGPSGSGKT
ncbi:MAG TPA: ABC transporter ATP-binding protein, partial [Myxococcales bacterium]|nr:ABC transporter ATP-binding protein [Myxococcales bacterium]